jgi:hypothetical protein
MFGLKLNMELLIFEFLIVAIIEKLKPDNSKIYTGSSIKNFLERINKLKCLLDAI